MTLRRIKLWPEGNITPPLEWSEGKYIRVVDIDDESGQIYSNGQKINFVERTAQVLLPPEVIKNLKATPYQILPAPGVGKAYFIDDAIFQYKFKTTPYGNVGPNDLELYWHTAGQTYTLFSSNGFIDQTNSMVIDTMVTTVSVAQSSVENQEVMFGHTGGATEFITGDGSLGIFLIYRIVDLF